MKALSGGVYNQSEAGPDDLRVLTGVLLSAAALADIEAVILRWRCGGGSNGGASLLIDSVTLVDSLTMTTVTKSCCRSSSGSMGTSTSCSTLTSPGSGIIISFRDSAAPLTLSDSDTPAPYSAPSPSLDLHPVTQQSLSRIGRCAHVSSLAFPLFQMHFITHNAQVYTFAPTIGVSDSRSSSKRRRLRCCRLQVTFHQRCLFSSALAAECIMTCHSQRRIGFRDPCTGGLFAVVCFCSNVAFPPA
jgi:hypothetical protein